MQSIDFIGISILVCSAGWVSLSLATLTHNGMLLLDELPMGLNQVEQARTPLRHGWVSSITTTS